MHIIKDGAAHSQGKPAPPRNIDEWLQVRDVCYPHVVQENHPGHQTGFVYTTIKFIEKRMEFRE